MSQQLLLPSDSKFYQVKKYFIINQIEARNKSFVRSLLQHFNWKSFLVTKVTIYSKIGSPTALADTDLEKRLNAKAHKFGHGLYVPAGAFWGGDDVRKMADQGSLKVWMKLIWFCFYLGLATLAT